MDQNKQQGPPFIPNPMPIIFHWTFQFFNPRSIRDLRVHDNIQYQLKVFWKSCPLKYRPLVEARSLENSYFYFIVPFAIFCFYCCCSALAAKDLIALALEANNLNNMAVCSIFNVSNQNWWKRVKQCFKIKLVKESKGEINMEKTIQHFVGDSFIRKNFEKILKNKYIWEIFIKRYTFVLRNKISKSS